MSQSTENLLRHDYVIASWELQVLQGEKCLAKGHKAEVSSYMSFQHNFSNKQPLVESDLHVLNGWSLKIG